MEMIEMTSWNDDIVFIHSFILTLLLSLFSYTRSRCNEWLTLKTMIIIPTDHKNHTRIDHWLLLCSSYTLLEAIHHLLSFEKTFTIWFAHLLDIYVKVIVDVSKFKSYCLNRFCYFDYKYKHLLLRRPPTLIQKK